MRANIAPVERMSTNPTDLLTSIPARDESIRRALADIEQKLGAWSAALMECDYSARGAAKNDRLASPGAGAAPDLKAPATAAFADASTKTHAADSTPAVSENEASAGCLENEAVGADDDVEYQTPEEERMETPISRHANPDDDDGVLAGLSPESAKAIKVQWRLLEGTKSLRQLVEEHKARLARGDGSRDGKRSWWSRGKG